MIRHPGFDARPWALLETELDIDVLAQTESLFALANGHIGWRGNLDEGEPHGLPGSYLNGVYESGPLPYAEAGYGYPESGQTVINVTDGKLVRVLVDDEPFDVRYGELRAHQRELDFRAGTLTRTAEWTAPTGRTMRMRSVRLVSFTQRAIAAVCYDVEPVDGPTRIVVQSELVANEPLPVAQGDPRGATGMSSPMEPDRHAVTGDRVNLLHRTRNSGLGVAAAMVHDVSAPVELDIQSESMENLGRTTVSALLRPGERLRIVKFVAYGWSERRSATGLRAQVDAALVAARQTGWDGLLAEQREFLDCFWTRADVELDGDPEVQQAVRFGLFHVAQAGARAERRAMPAKGLTGSGYDGHCFWDSEIYALPVLTYTMPDAARDALLWRHDILPRATERAAELGLRGAAFPWRTINGAECSAYWPAGTAAFHINAGIADAVIRYVDATGDETFARGPGLDLLVNTARLWMSLGHDTVDGFRIDGVTGPDEYSAIADNNVYTNLMAKQNLIAAAEAGAEADSGVPADEVASWRAAAEHMMVPYDERLGVHPQSEGFTDHQPWDFAAMKADDYPLLLRYPYFDLYRKQVVKQADLVLAMYLACDAFTDEQKARNFAYYEALTVRDSSLSACVQAVLAAELGHAELARAYLDEAALMDLDDLEHNTRDGLHIASLAGAWLALVAGFGGMRHGAGQPLSFRPTLPPGINRLAFRLFFRGRLCDVEITDGTVTYTLLDGEPLDITHYGELCTMDTREPVSRPIPDLPAGQALESPTQPAGRAPQRRSERWNGR
ncbi:MAG TPA: glycosyl hydrolase family 65 protein [Pseudonocardiaceae bacterium]|jgi:alpha,alpha-trehalose phosphorylase|nr:glycosyl hydrolase family 65 protein [Pseudonocardiaceae bacterium]